MRLHTLVAVAAMVTGSARLVAQTVTTGTIDGIVTDTTLSPIAEASVSIPALKLVVVTSANGRFQILGLRRGEYELVIRRLGYRPASTRVSVSAGDTARVAVTMRPSVANLDTMQVAARSLSPRMQEFEERRKAGEGQFMTLAEIEQHNSVMTEDLIRPFKGVMLWADSVYNRRELPLRGCRMQFFIDDVAVLMGLSQLPSPKDLAGIEVYTGPATIPLRYKSYSTKAGYCGVILIWTKDGSEPGT